MRTSIPPLQLLLAIGLTGCYLAHERGVDAAIEAGPRDASQDSAAPLDAVSMLDAAGCGRVPPPCDATTQVVDLSTLGCDASGMRECAHVQLNGVGPDDVDVSTNVCGSDVVPGGRLRIVRCSASTSDPNVRVSIVSSPAGDSAGGFGHMSPVACSCEGLTVFSRVPFQSPLDLGVSDADELQFFGADVVYAVDVCSTEPCP